MNRAPKRSPLDELHRAAAGAGWWVELTARPSSRDGTPGRLDRLQVRRKAGPNAVRYVALRDHPTAVPAAARALTRTLLEGAA